MVCVSLVREDVECITEGETMKATIYVFEGTPEELAEYMSEYGLPQSKEEDNNEPVDYSNSRWTDEERRYLVDNYETQTWEELAANLGRTVAAVRRKWRDEDIQELLEE